MTDLRFFIYLGANEFEKKIGQNIKIDLSLKIPYENTEDKLENTINYGLVYEYLEQKILELNGTELLEYLAEQILTSIGLEFKGILAAKIAIEKGYVPLKNFTGKVQIVVEKDY
jgi:dihydroneopterin aldolase